MHEIFWVAFGGFWMNSYQGVYVVDDFGNAVRVHHHAGAFNAGLPSDALARWRS